MLGVAKQLAFGPDNYKCNLFAEYGNVLVQRSKLAPEDIGVGPFRRQAVLSFLLEIDKEARLGR